MSNLVPPDPEKLKALYEIAKDVFAPIELEWLANARAQDADMSKSEDEFLAELKRRNPEAAKP